MSNLHEVAVIDYGMGNVGSILNILRRVGARPILTADPAALSQSGRLILPGVGAFDAGMRQLESRQLIPVLQELVIERQRPILGLCLGMQLIGRGSSEGVIPGLGWIDAHCVRFDAGQDPSLRVPHMGWNTVRISRPHSLFQGLEGARYYFVHSYHAVCRAAEDVIGTTPYGREFPSAIARNNVMGVQFHPEKSHRFGMQLFRNFLSSCN